MEAAAALASVVRRERTRLVSTLVRRYGFDLAEEAVDRAIAAALEEWPVSGIPTSPRAWLLAVAKRRAIDHVRHRVKADDVHASIEHTSESATETDDEGGTFPDDRLRLIFTCCHPAIAREAQVALALRWVCGLSTEDVARAFCVPVPTMAQRLTRSKSKIETAGIPYEIPDRTDLEERTAAVLEVVYAIFNEGYVATSGPSLERSDLAEEALYLGELLVSLLPASADTKAMLALLSFVHARRGARVSPEGELVPLDEQDRARWDTALVARGDALLEAALASGPPSAYAIEAAISALHCKATSYPTTDFAQIVVLYGLLRKKTDAPIVKVNEAFARSMVHGPEAALVDLEALANDPELAEHAGYHAAKADVLARLGRSEPAKKAYERAIALTKNEAEKRFLARRRDALRT